MVLALREKLAEEEARSADLQASERGGQGAGRTHVEWAAGFPSAFRTLKRAACHSLGLSD